MSAITLIFIGFLLCQSTMAQKESYPHPNNVNYPGHIGMTDATPLADDDELNQVLESFDKQLGETADEILENFDQWLVESDKKYVAEQIFDADVDGFIDS